LYLTCYRHSVQLRHIDIERRYQGSKSFDKPQRRFALVGFRGDEKSCTFLDYRLQPPAQERVIVRDKD
jgi:hypothetical protein